MAVDNPPGDDPGPASRLNEILDDVRARVDARRRAGGYPPGLEDTVDAIGREVAAARRPTLDAVRGRVERVVPPPFDLAELPHDSRLPGGKALHRTVARLVGRHVAVVAVQLQDLATAVREALDALVDAVEVHADRAHGDVGGQFHAVWERLAAFERAPAGSDAPVAEVSRRVEVLERATRPSGLPGGLTRRRILDELGPARDAARERLGEVAALVGDHPPVLQVGVGRGELLELLAARRVAGTGVDDDASLVEAARDAGGAVTEASILTHLSGIEDGSLGSLVVTGVVERLALDEVADVVRLAAAKVRGGGPVVAEVAEPGSPAVDALAALGPDRTGAPPAGLLALLFRDAGFVSVDVEPFVSPWAGYRLIARR